MALQTLEKGQLIRVVHRTRSGNVVRISKYLKIDGVQKPVSEMIYYANGRSTLYLYSETGDSVDHVIQFEKPARTLTFRPQAA